MNSECKLLDKKETDQHDSRIIGLDILRIISSIGITMIHFLGYTSVFSVIDSLSVNGILAYIFNIFSRTSVNIFVIISGYFLARSKFKWGRVLLVAGETLFYSITLFAVGVAFNLESMSLSVAIKSIIPIISRHYWFATSYVVLYLISPFINKMIAMLDEKEYTILVLGAAVLFSAWTTFAWFSEGALTGGKTSILWLTYMYLIGGYFRMYPPKIKNSVLLITGGIIIILLVLYQYLKGKVAFLSNFAFLEEDSLFSLYLSAALFLLFLNIKSKNEGLNKFITAVASASFGVYLIQEHCMFRNWLWLEVVRSNTMVNNWYFFPVFVLVIILLFALAFIVSKVYKLLFKFVENQIKKKQD